MKWFDKLIEKVQRDIEKIADDYGISPTAVVWIGDNHYIAVVNGEEIRI